MKNILLRLTLVSMFISMLAPVFQQAAVAQVNSHALMLRREASYTALVHDVHTVRNTKMMDTVKPTTSVKLATLYAKNNIFPTRGSVALIYKLNPDLDASKPLPVNYKIRAPYFPPASPALLQRSQQEYAILKVPNATANERFLSLTRSYGQNLTLLQGIRGYSAGFRDTILAFQNNVLPVINEKAGIICQAQMNYFITELGHINQLVDDVLHKKRDPYSVVYSINQMIADFMEITNLGLAKGAGQQRGGDPSQQKKKASPAQKPGRAGGGSAVFPEIDAAAEWREMPFYTAWMNPPNVDIYVFKSDKNGTQDDQPSMNSYDVYYDSNGFLYSLTPGCDTLSFFSYHPANPASTLPLILGKGNYCFVLRDRKTGKKYLQPGINLAVNLKYDENNRVIIPFYLEED